MNERQKIALFSGSVVFVVFSIGLIDGTVAGIIKLFGLFIVIAVPTLVLYIILGAPTAPYLKYKEKEKIIRKELAIIHYKASGSFWERAFQKVVAKIFLVMNVEFEDTKIEKKGGMTESIKDELFDQAVAIAIKHDFITTSLLQRRLEIGFVRAARLMDQLEKEGIVGEGEGDAARIVLVKSSKGKKVKKLPN